MHDQAFQFENPPVPTAGRIDIHCHLLPGIDDGCESIEETIECIHLLKAGGFVGSICTPHTGPEPFPLNTYEYIRMMVEQTRRELAERGIDYPLWPGGEVRLHKRLVKWFQAHGVPTLADSRCVLVDFWDAKWPRWVPGIFQWLIAEGYQPILAHPERLPPSSKLTDQLQTLLEMGVWFQGNFRCMTGEDGYQADQAIRTMMRESKYHLLALDTHRPDSLPGRLDGMKMAHGEFGSELVDRLCADAPRQLIFTQP